MKLEREWYCFNCRKPVDVVVSWIGNPQCCKECGSIHIMSFGQATPEDFRKLVKKFKEQTDEM